MIDQNLSTYLDLGSSLVLVVVGQMISAFVAFIVKKLKEPTVSQKERFVLVYTYYLSFFNSSILLLLLNSNFKEGGIPILSHVINKGKSSDWDQNLYKIMGPPLVNLVVMNEVVKTIMTVIDVFILRLKIAWDRGSFYS